MVDSRAVMENLTAGMMETYVVASSVDLWD